MTGHVEQNTHIGQVFTTLGIMLRANDESRVKSERLTAVWQHKKANAGTKKITSMCPAWLSLNKKTNAFTFTKLATTVKEIFELSIQGYGTSAICQTLNDNPKKFPANNKVKGWHKSYVQKILNNPAVYGEYQPHMYRGKERAPSGAPIPNYFPAVVTKQVFDLSRARMEQRKTSGARRKGANFANLFTRITHCSHCGAVVVFRDKGVGSRGGKYLRCGNAERHMNCSAPAWEYGEFESSFFAFVSEIDLDAIFTSDKTELLKKSALERLAILEAKHTSAQQAYENIFKLLELTDGEVAQDIATRLTSKKAEIAEIEAEIERVTYELLQLTQTISGAPLKENLLAYEKLINEIDSEGLQAIRHKIYNQICHLTTDIRLYNLSKYEAGDDLDLLDADFLKILKKKRYKTESEQMTYLLTKAGQRTFDKYHRTFTVEFKNGVVKYIQPSKRLVMDFNPSPL